MLKLTQADPILPVAARSVLLRTLPKRIRPTSEAVDMASGYSPLSGSGLTGTAKLYAAGYRARAYRVLAAAGWTSATVLDDRPGRPTRVVRVPVDPNGRPVAPVWR